MKLQDKITFSFAFVDKTIIKIEQELALIWNNLLKNCDFK